MGGEGKEGEEGAMPEMIACEGPFHLERCWPTGSLVESNVIGEENCVFARDNVLINGLRSDCFSSEDLDAVNRVYVRIKNKLRRLGATGFANLSITSYEKICCSGMDHLLGCFDGKDYTREKSCLDVYLGSVGLPSLTGAPYSISDWAKEQLEAREATE